MTATNMCSNFGDFRCRPPPPPRLTTTSTIWHKLAIITHKNIYKNDMFAQNTEIFIGTFPVYSSIAHKAWIPN